MLEPGLQSGHQHQVQPVAHRGGAHVLDLELHVHLLRQLQHPRTAVRRIVGAEERNQQAFEAMAPKTEKKT